MIVAFLTTWAKYPCGYLENRVMLFLETMFSQNICFQWYHIHKIHTKSPRSTLLPSRWVRYLDRYSLCKPRWEPNDLNANNPCPAARQKQYWYFISLLRFSALKCKPNGQKNVVVLENLIIESLHMIETEL